VRTGRLDSSSSFLSPATVAKNTDHRRKKHHYWGTVAKKHRLPSQKTPATGQKNTDQHNRLEIHRLPSQKTPVPWSTPSYMWRLAQWTELFRQLWQIPGR
jgi:hypothetical protein